MGTSAVLNGGPSPKAFPRDSFDFIDAISLFTHLTPTAQDRWMADVRRVLNPCGLFLFTVHGERFVGHLDAEQQERFAAGDVVVLEAERSGKEGCAAFHPPAPLGLQDNYLAGSTT